MAAFDCDPTIPIDLMLEEMALSGVDVKINIWGSTGYTCDVSWRGRQTFSGGSSKQQVVGRCWLRFREMAVLFERYHGGLVDPDN